MTTIHTPVPGYSGTTYIGPLVLQFVDGVAEHNGVLPAGVLGYIEAQGYTIDAPEPVEPVDEQPAGNASTEAWAAFALAHGVTAAELEGMTRDQMREQYGNRVAGPSAP